MILIRSIVYLAVLGVVFFAAGRLLPKRLFNFYRRPYRQFAFE